MTNDFHISYLMKDHGWKQCREDFVYSRNNYQINPAQSNTMVH